MSVGNDKSKCLVYYVGWDTPLSYKAMLSKLLFAYVRYLRSRNDVSVRYFGSRMVADFGYYRVDFAMQDTFSVILAVNPIEVIEGKPFNNLGCSFSMLSTKQVFGACLERYRQVMLDFLNLDKESFDGFMVKMDSVSYSKLEKFYVGVQEQSLSSIKEKHLADILCYDRSVFMDYLSGFSLRDLTQLSVTMDCKMGEALQGSLYNVMIDYDLAGYLKTVTGTSCRYDPWDSNREKRHDRLPKFRVYCKDASVWNEYKVMQERINDFFSSKIKDAKILYDVDSIRDVIRRHCKENNIYYDKDDLGKYIDVLNPDLSLKLFSYLEIIKELARSKDDKCKDLDSLYEVERQKVKGVLRFELEFSRKALKQHFGSSKWEDLTFDGHHVLSGFLRQHFDFRVTKTEGTKPEEIKQVSEFVSQNSGLLSVKRTFEYKVIEKNIDILTLLPRSSKELSRLLKVSDNSIRALFRNDRELRQFELITGEGSHTRLSSYGKAYKFFVTKTYYNTIKDNILSYNISYSNISISSLVFSFLYPFRVLNKGLAVVTQGGDVQQSAQENVCSKKVFASFSPLSLVQDYFFSHDGVVDDIDLRKSLMAKGLCDFEIDDVLAKMLRCGDIFEVRKGFYRKL